MTASDQATLSHTTSRDGTAIVYWTTGEGPPLVLVHGTSADHTRWDALRPHLEPSSRWARNRARASRQRVAPGHPTRRG